MSGYSVAKQASDLFNRHGSLTARLVENGLAIEIRHADTGKHLTTLWAPDIDGWTWPLSPNSETYRCRHADTGKHLTTLWAPDIDGWTWPLSPNSETYRCLPKATPLDLLILAVATSILDEGARR